MGLGTDLLKRVLPRAAYDALRDGYTRRWLAREYGGLSTEQVFTKVYESGVWGRSADPADSYFSGTGSHSPAVVQRYVGAVGSFLQSFENKPSVVDLGCGDFAIGSQIRPYCSHYVACDIVSGLIERNRARYGGLEVDFRVLDLASDELPRAEIVFVRQVLQHLSNDRLAAALPRLASSYRFAVVSEHLPARPDFPHNLDKPTGPDTRLRVGSGVVLTSPPFGLKARSERRLCEVTEGDGIVVTTLYEF